MLPGTYIGFELTHQGQVTGIALANGRWERPYHVWQIRREKTLSISLKLVMILLSP